MHSLQQGAPEIKSAFHRTPPAPHKQRAERARPRLQASKALPPKQDMAQANAFSGNDLVVLGGCDLDLTSGA